MRDRQMEFSPFRNFATQAAHSVRLSSIDRRASGVPAATPACMRSYTAKSQCIAGPSFGSGLGWARLFSSPQMRGVARRDDALSGLRRTARTITPGGPGSPGPGASADAPRQLGAPRGISGFTPSTVRSDRPAVLVPREGSPPPPGDMVMLTTLAGAASRPNFTTSRDDAPQWTGRCLTYGDIHLRSSDQ